MGDEHLAQEVTRITMRSWLRPRSSHHDEVSLVCAGPALDRGYGFQGGVL